MPSQAPRQRSWIGLALVAGLLLALQAGLFWQQQRADERLERLHHALDVARADAHARQQALNALENRLGEADRALVLANEQATSLAERLAAMEQGARTSRPSPSGKPSGKPGDKPSGNPEDKPVRPGPVEAKCLNTPLCPD